MKVTLIDYTGKGRPDAAHYAAALLAFTKSTRLNMTAGGLQDFLDKPHEELLKELSYMANTIPSSWEFIDFTFMIEGVTRAFTHQFVRSRTWSFAQQTMRVLDVSGWDYLTGPSIKEIPALEITYQRGMKQVDETYRAMIKHGAKIEDARGILPTNILTNIVGKCNMRSFVELVRKRTSPRTQGEYRDVLDAMKAAALAVHPWLSLFIERDMDKAIADLQDAINYDVTNEASRTAMTKLLDQIRAQS